MSTSTPQREIRVSFQTGVVTARDAKRYARTHFTGQVVACRRVDPTKIETMTEAFAR